VAGFPCGKSTYWLSGLACLNERDSCMAFAVHGTDGQARRRLAVPFPQKKAGRQANIQRRSVNGMCADDLWIGSKAKEKEVWGF
jgi:hypothetical protein